MSKVSKWLVSIVVTPMIVLIGAYCVTLLEQLWPEKIEDTFKSACDVNLDPESEVVDRVFSYSNFMHGVWYTDQGKLRVTPSFASQVQSLLSKNPEYTFKGNGYEKSVAGKILGVCSVDERNHEISFNLVLW